MADRTLTINHADGGSETYTLKTEDVLGVRNMQVDGETVTIDRTAPDLVRTIIADGQTITIDTTREGVRTLTVDGTEITIDRTEEANLGSFIQEFTGAAAAYSLRDLASTSGNTTVVRVRRSSDNVEEPFTASEVSDGTLVAWVGAGNDGFVEAWYDQSGNGNDATQQVSGSQPKIVDAGVLVSGGLVFDGVDDYLITAQSGQFSQPVSLFQVFSSDALVASGRFQIDASSTFMLSGGESSIYYFAGYLLNSNINFPTGGDTLHSVVFNGSSSTVFADGSSVATGNVSSGAFQKTFSIGARRTGTQASNLSYKEFIIYNTDQSANRVAIETNINNQYDIY